jgi:hypothetical protein
MFRESELRTTSSYEEGSCKRVERIETRSSEENKRSASEACAFEIEDYMCCSAVILGVCDLMRLV